MSLQVRPTSSRPGPQLCRKGEVWVEDGEEEVGGDVGVSDDGDSDDKLMVMMVIVMKCW